MTSCAGARRTVGARTPSPNGSSPVLELVADIVRHQDEVRAQVADILSGSEETQALADMVNRALRDVPAQQLTDLVRLLSEMDDDGSSSSTRRVCGSGLRDY